MGTSSRFNQRGKNYQFSKTKLKPGQPISVHADFAKTISGKLRLFKAVPITFIAIKSFFSILCYEKRIIKVIGIVCSFHLVTLGADTFARKKIREIFAFRKHKLSRMGQKSFFREHKLSRITFFMKFFFGENKGRKKTFRSSSTLSCQKDKYLLKFT